MPQSATQPWREGLLLSEARNRGAQAVVRLRCLHADSSYAFFNFATLFSVYETNRPRALNFSPIERDFHISIHVSN